MNKLIMIVAVAAVAGGCITVNKNDGGESNMKMRVCKDIIHEKVSVGAKQVTAQDQIHCLFGLICWGSSAKHIADQTDDLFSFGVQIKAKNGAYANACDAAKCDQLVATRYKITTDDYFVYSKCKAEVTGYPAKVEGVDVVTPPCVQKGNCCPAAK